MSKPKDKTPEDKETKDKELKDKNNLVGRVRKVIKKSRRKLSEEKFEKELKRTIEFLEQMQAKLNNHQGGEAEKKVERKAAVSAVKKPKTDKKAAKKAVAKIAGKKSKGAASKNKSVALVAAGSAAASQAETQSTKK
jgi:hypothetical protein